MGRSMIEAAYNHQASNEHFSEHEEKVGYQVSFTTQVETARWL